jgi:hypothetical protein
MMTFESKCAVSFACLVSLAGGCGAENMSGRAIGSAAPGELCDHEPPGVIMSSPAGELIGGYGSSCVSCLDDSGSGETVCGNTPTTTTGYTVVHPGDPISFSMPEATLTGSQLIRFSKCRSSADILHEISEDAPIDIDVPPGNYVLTFSSDFEAGRKSGSMSAGFGLVVDPVAEREVVTDPTAFDLQDHCLEADDKDAG